jgi:carbon storage regulator
MLVLTRRTGESIIIGNGIKLTVVNIGPGRVKIGIEAPPSVRVDREEIHSRIMQEKSSDVLEAVSSDVAASGDQATTISSGPETGILRSGESTSPTTSSNPTPLPVPVSKLSKFRAPRKPR